MLSTLAASHGLTPAAAASATHPFRLLRFCGLLTVLHPARPVPDAPCRFRDARAKAATDGDNVEARIPNVFTLQVPRAMVTPDGSADQPSV